MKTLTGILSFKPFLYIIFVITSTLFLGCGKSGNPTPTTTTTRPITVNGACDNSRNNGCTTGTLNDQEDTETHYLWQCLGTNRGTNADCSRQKSPDVSLDPINGECDNSRNNGCTTGTLNDHADTETHYQWQCLGINDGANVNCAKAIPPDEGAARDGLCDNRENNGCSRGDLINDERSDSETRDTDTHYRWQCDGINGGNSVSCSKQKTSTGSIQEIDGVCNDSVVFGCLEGQLSQSRGNTNSLYRWECVGIGGGTTDNCEANRQTTAQISGVCDNTNKNKCLEGRFENRDDTETLYQWRCLGINNGQNADCSKQKPTIRINGDCSTTLNQCREGSFVNRDDTETHYQWRCDGLNGGDHEDCSRPKPTTQVNGRCNNSRVNGCFEGEVIDTADSNSHYQWQCKGQNGGSLDNCSKMKSTSAGLIHGRCVSDNIILNKCESGRFEDVEDEIVRPDGSDNYVRYKWKCMGENGGNDADCDTEDTLATKADANPCPDGTINDCNANLVVRDVPDSLTHYRWQCINHNADDSTLVGEYKVMECFRLISSVLPENGVCNNNILGACTKGTSNFDINSPGTSRGKYRWTCEGTTVDGNTGRTDNCSIAVPTDDTDGECDTSQEYTCTKGTPFFSSTSLEQTDTAKWKWKCKSSDGKANSNVCERNKPNVVPACGSNINECTGELKNDEAVSSSTEDYLKIGQSSPAIAELEGFHYRWECKGTGTNSDTVSCNSKKPALNGTCNILEENGCLLGELSDLADTETHFKWRCNGIRDGIADECSKLKELEIKDFTVVDSLTNSNPTTAPDILEDKPNDCELDFNVKEPIVYIFTDHINTGSELETLTNWSLQLISPINPSNNLDRHIYVNRACPTGITTDNIDAKIEAIISGNNLLKGDGSSFSQTVTSGNTYYNTDTDDDATEPDETTITLGTTGYIKVGNHANVPLELTHDDIPEAATTDPPRASTLSLEGFLGRLFISKSALKAVCTKTTPAEKKTEVKLLVRPYLCAEEVKK